MNINHSCFFLLIFIAVFYACSKDSADKTAGSVYAGTFEASADIRDFPAELYVKAGKITDTAKISAFIKRKQIGNILTARVDVSDMKLIVNKDNSAEFTGLYYPDQLKGTLLRYSESLLLLTAKDSVIVKTPEGSAVPVGYYGNGLAMIYQCAQPASVFVVYSQSSCIALAPGSGYSQQCRYLPVTELEYEDDHTLAMPALIYRGYSGQGSQQCSTGFSYVPGLLNPNFYKDLGPTDSVIVVKKQIILKKG